MQATTRADDERPTSGHDGVTETGSCPVTAWQPKGWGPLFAALALMLVVLFLYVLLSVFAVGFALAYSQPDFSAITDSQELLSQLDGTAILATLTVGQLVAGGLAFLFVFLLGGRELVRPRSVGFGLALRAGAWLLVFSGVVSPCLEIGLRVLSGVSLAEVFGHVPSNLPQELFLVAAFSLSVGLFEEGLFRGLLFEGLLARMGITRRGVIGALVVSSLAFGLLHLVGSNISDGASIIQAVLKVAQAGLLGFVFATVLIKTRNLWCAVAMHAAYDFLAMLPSVVLGELGEMTNALMQGYVQSGEDAPLVIVIYLITCAFTVPALLVCVRILRGVEVPERGAFLTSLGKGAKPPTPPHGWRPI